MNNNKSADTTRPTILLFQRDLRLRDHRPLRAAIDRGAPIIPLYVLDNATPDIEKPGAASQWWLHHSLAQLSNHLREKNSRLILRSGPTADVVRDLAADVDAGAIHFHHSVLPGHDDLENDIAANAKKQDIDCRRFKGELLFDPADIRTGSGGPYKVFTPFWRACLEQDRPGDPIPVPQKIPAPESWPASETLEDWQLTPSKPNWAKGFAGKWQPGEEGARKTLDQFIDNAILDYKKQRDYPATRGTSRLSPHLHYGEISIRDCWHETKQAHPDAKGAESYRRELGWREFCYHLLHHWPGMTHDPFREEFSDYPWRENKAHIKAWQQGNTGFPIIDAAMRQLWHTGWMHNRLRMLVGSFLVKNLQQHWHVGQDWFWDTLVDADVANNSAGWQWIAGSGADAAPYFRIFNPVTQSEKFDKDGEFIRRYVPELADLPAPHIHDPSSAPKEALDKAGVTLGKTYPKALVDLKETRQKALDGYEKVKAAKSED